MCVRIACCSEPCICLSQQRRCRRCCDDRITSTKRFADFYIKRSTSHIASLSVAHVCFCVHQPERNETSSSSSSVSSASAAQWVCCVLYAEFKFAYFQKFALRDWAYDSRRQRTPTFAPSCCLRGVSTFYARQVRLKPAGAARSIKRLLISHLRAIRFVQHISLKMSRPFEPGFRGHARPTCRSACAVISSLCNLHTKTTHVLVCAIPFIMQGGTYSINHTTA